MDLAETHSTNDFIKGQYIDTTLCDEIINYFEASNDKTPGAVTEGINESKKKSTDLVLTDNKLLSKYNTALQQVFNEYIKTFPMSHTECEWGVVEPINIQRYYPKEGFYDGTRFHRVIKDFMIQGGCPLGTGTGGPGFQFKDEVNAIGLGLADLKALKDGQTHPWLLVRSQEDFQRTVLGPVLQKMGIKDEEEFKAKMEEIQNTVNALSLVDIYANQGYVFDKNLTAQKPVKGVIAMANSGPNTNGSQFFINVADTPHLTGKHTVFGKVIEGMDIVEKISNLETDAASKPNAPVVIESIRLEKKD